MGARLVALIPAAPDDDVVGTIGSVLHASVVLSERYEVVHPDRHTTPVDLLLGEAFEMHSVYRCANTQFQFESVRQEAGAL